MILLLDNYDSFTFNLYQALSELGADVLVVRNDKIAVDEVEAMLPAIERHRHLPRPVHARTRRASPSRWCSGLPAGSRSSASAWGTRRSARPSAGAIVRAPRLMHGKTSQIYHDGSGLFTGLPNPFEA